MNRRMDVLRVPVVFPRCPWMFKVRLEPIAGFVPALLFALPLVGVM